MAVLVRVLVERSLVGSRAEVESPTFVYRLEFRRLLIHHHSTDRVLSHVSPQDIARWRYIKLPLYSCKYFKGSLSGFNSS